MESIFYTGVSAGNEVYYDVIREMCLPTRAILFITFELLYIFVSVKRIMFVYRLGFFCENFITSAFSRLRTIRQRRQKTRFFFIF